MGRCIDMKHLIKCLKSMSCGHAWKQWSYLFLLPLIMMKIIVKISGGLFQGFTVTERLRVFFNKRRFTKKEYLWLVMCVVGQCYKQFWMKSRFPRNWHFYEDWIQINAIYQAKLSFNRCFLKKWPSFVASVKREI